MFPVELRSAPKRIKKMAPANPKKTPITFRKIKGDLKNKIPKTKVNRGVKELSTPAIELLISVCAKAKRNAGKKLPAKPTTNRYLVLLQSIVLKR